MLTEEEWAVVSPHLSNAIEQIKHYREKNNCSLAEANKNGFGQRVLEIYEQLTGFKETNPNAIFHHRLGIYGPPCQVCGKPLRTPQARYCASCSVAVESNIALNPDGFAAG